MTGAVLLYDGLCALCNGLVRFILARERKDSLRFAPLQGEFARGVLRRHPALAGEDTVIWVDQDPGRERVDVRSGAVFRVLDYLGGGWKLLGVLRLVPRAVRDWVYDQVARRRARFAGTYETCPVPPASLRHRFLP